MVQVGNGQGCMFSFALCFAPAMNCFRVIPELYSADSNRECIYASEEP